MCGYQLQTNHLLNFTEIRSAQAKISQKGFDGATFLTHTVSVNGRRDSRKTPSLPPTLSRGGLKIEYRATTEAGNRHCITL